jgi:predicted RecB family nuclease
VVVYSAYENGVIGEMRDLFPDLEVDLNALSDRLFDLLPVIRTHVYLPRFYGSYSIKKVGPALAPDFTYDDLDNVSDGAAAAQAYFRLATNSLMANEDATTVRQALLDYCKRDTEAMISVHGGLKDLIREQVAAAAAISV